MKKKLAYIFTVMLMIFALTGCGQDAKDVDYNGKSYSQIAQETMVNAYMVNQLATYAAGKDISQEEREYVLSQSENLSESVFDSMDKMTDVIDQYGACTTFGDDFNPDTFITDENFSITKAGNTLTADLTVRCGDRDVIIQLVYDYYSMEITSVGVDPVLTLGEKMSNAGKNTLISMSIVFGVLILISLIISCFKIFPYLEKKKASKNNAKEESATVAPAATPVAQADDSELIAVIAAAIAASEGTSTSDFVVRSINRR